MCGVLVLNAPGGDVLLKLHNEVLKIVERYKYLAITLESKRLTNLFRTHFSLMLEKARTRVATIRKFGFREDGLRIRSSIRLYIILIRPFLEYCAQVLPYTRYSKRSQVETATDFAKELEHYQTRTPKKLIGCLRNTPPAMVRLFCGVEPLACRLEMLNLRYFWRTLHSPPDAIAHRILVLKSKTLSFSTKVLNIKFSTATVSMTLLLSGMESIPKS